MLTKEIFNIIEQTINQMTNENDGVLDLIPNMELIARRAEVPMEILKDYFRITLLGD